MTTKALCILAFIITLSQAASLKLTGTVRDFSPETNPDFEATIYAETGVVAEYLDGNRKPIYNGGSGTVTTHGADYFNPL